MARHQHHLGVADQVLVVQQGHSVAVGQLQVQQDQVGLLQRHLPAGIAQRPRRGGGESFRPNQGGHHPRGIRVILDD